MPIKPISENGVSSNLPAGLDRFLQDFAQSYGDIDYNDIIELGNVWKSLSTKTTSMIKKLVKDIKSACRETGLDCYELASEYPDDKENCDNLVSIIKTAKSRISESTKKLKESYYGLFEYTPGGPEDGIYCDHCDLLDVTVADSEEEAERIFSKKYDYENSYYVNEIDKADYNEFNNSIEDFNREFGEDDIIDVTESKKVTESNLKVGDKVRFKHAGGVLSREIGKVTKIYKIGNYDFCDLTWNDGDTSEEVDCDMCVKLKDAGAYQDKINSLNSLDEFESKKSMKESKLREFTDLDWNGFAGAERFEDGSEPLIAEFIDGIATVLVSGISDEDYTAQVQLLYLDEDEDEASEGGWYKDFETKQDAVRFAKQLGGQLDYFTPEDTTYDDMENIAYSEKMGMLY